MRGQRHAPAAFYPRGRPGTHFTGGWVEPRAGWTGAENLAPTKIRYIELYILYIYKVTVMHICFGTRIKLNLTHVC
jgi:hypothetical protein